MARRSDDDFRAEIASHIQMETDRLVAQGLGPEEARCAAERRFGNVTRVRERFYESRRLLWTDRLQHDLRYAVRTLWQTPVFTLIAILTVAIGIGASTAVATQVNAIFFESLPVADAPTLRSLAWNATRHAFTDRLYAGETWQRRIAEGEGLVTFPHEIFRAIEDRSTAFADVACWRSASEVLTETSYVRVHAVSGSFFHTVGIPALMGRTIADEDDRPGAPLVALARDPALLNQTVRLHGHSFTVVGILPDDFAGLAPTEPADFVVAYAADHVFPIFQRSAWAECRIVARLAPGASWDAARAETALIVAQAIQANPPNESYDPPSILLHELSAHFAELQQNVSAPLRLVAVVVGLLLLITCANISGLLFSRARSRQKELATRLALGGSRRRVLQQLLTETLLLCTVGGAAGVALAYVFSPLLPLLLTQLGGTPVGLEIRPNAGVLAFALGVSISCGLLFGIWPAVAAAGIDPALALKQAAGIAPPSRLRVGKAALAVQLALAIVVTVGAALLVRTMINLRAVPLGYTPEGIAFVETNNPVGRSRAFVEETLARLESLPGVNVATVSQWPIFNNTTLRAQFCIPGADLPQQRLDLSYVFPRFFDTWGVRLIRGQDLPDRVEPVAIVNETFARRFFPDQNPIGQVFATGPCPGRTQLRIIGLAEDHIDRQRVELVPAVYVRYPQAGALYATTYAVRTSGDERAMLPALRRVIAERGISVNSDARTGVDYRDSIIRREHVLTLLLVCFASTALFISCLGVYGMLAYTVSWRTSEIGLRMAIGAAPAQLLWMIVRESLTPVVAGAIAGLAASTWFGQYVESVLFGISTRDPVAAVAAVATLIVTAAIAAVLAAWRACRIEPVPALRCE